MKSLAWHRTRISMPLQLLRATRRKSSHRIATVGDIMLRKSVNFKWMEFESCISLSTFVLSCGSSGECLRDSTDSGSKYPFLRELREVVGLYSRKSIHRKLWKILERLQSHTHPYSDLVKGGSGDPVFSERGTRTGHKSGSLTKYH